MDEGSAEKQIDWFGPEIVSIFVTAAVGDLLFFLILPHYIAGVVMLLILWPKTRGFLAKFLLAIVVINPVPLLFIGAWGAILLSNKIIAEVAEQAIIQAVSAATAGGGEVLEAGAVAGEAAEEAARVAAVRAAAEAGEVAEEAGRTTEAALEAGKGAEAGARAEAEAAGAEVGEGGTERTPGKKIEPEALGEERELLGEEGQLQKELLEETPAPEAEVPEEEAPKPRESEAERKIREARERAEKLKEWMERIRPKEEEPKSPVGDVEEDEPQDVV